MTTLWLDYETRSEANLLKVGAYNYAEHKSTKILIASYAIDDGPIKRWEAWRGRVILAADLIKALRNPRVTIRAHNATFERLITYHCLGINVPPQRWYCTSYQSRMAGCPSKLDDLARMVNPAWRKDQRGDMLIRRYSIPPFENDAEGLTEFGVYCDRDVEVMRKLSSFLPQLDDMALKVWSANEVINDRGMPIDTELCEMATGYIDKELAEVEARMVKLTGTKARGQALTGWIYDRLTDEQADVMKRGDKITLDKAARDQLLNLDLAPDVMEALELMDAASLSSTAKFQNLLLRTSSDGRLRGTHVCAGAPATGRYASWGVQTHNFPRESAKDPEEIRQRMKRRQPVTGQELKSMLRPAICAGPGKHIVRCDWSAIEARGLPWLVGTPDSLRYLATFEDTTRDIYVEQAVVAGLGPLRQEGKVVVLSLGYGGAVGALSTMARAYRVNIPNQPQVVARWRQGNAWAPEWWANLMSAARHSLHAKKPTVAGMIRFVGPGVMELPSGRRLFYPDLKYDAEDNLVYLKATRKPKAGEPWPHARLWHGVLAENATQAVCCDLLRELTVREASSPLIGHVHDECVAELSGDPREGKKWLRNCMLHAPAWARGFPLDAKAESAKRFGK